MGFKCHQNKSHLAHNFNVNSTKFIYFPDLGIIQQCKLKKFGTTQTCTEYALWDFLEIETLKNVPKAF
jgi:hypothetical protein